MDSLRAFREDVEYDVEEEEDSRMEAPPEIGFDERRMHVRAYNYWVSLLGGRAYPSINDVEPENLDDFGPNSVLLDFTEGSGQPRIAYLGRELREQCDPASEISSVSDVPSRSLLSRLTDHYLQIIANRAPIGFEAEFVSHAGANTMYRGILMPLSSDGDTIDYIYGVINWKEMLDHVSSERIGEQADRAVPRGPLEAAIPVWADGPNAETAEALDYVPPSVAGPDDTLELGVDHQVPDESTEWLPGLTPDEDASLADTLSAARASAEAASHADVRSRSALYRALGHAYDFAVAASADPAALAEILEDSGVKAQDRAPMTPIVKLVFGIDYDKARVTEFAAALSYARRRNLGSGELQPLLESFDGGLKGLVRAERRERAPARSPGAAEQVRDALRHAPPLAMVDVAAEGGEFVLLVARREADGRLAIVAPVSADEALLDRALRKAA